LVSSFCRRDFLAFVRAAEKFGRTELDKIAGEVEGKSREEVVAYSQVRLQRSSARVRA
jgi:SWI/SNF-related matrix-associated actin-dependent regulator of chromatin subfamily A member 5